MREVQAEIAMRASPGDAIAAFLAPAALRDWWGVEQCLVEPRPGGVYVLAWGLSEAGAQYVISGQVSALEPNALLRIEKLTYLSPGRDILGPMRLVVEARPAEDGRTLLRVTQDGYRSGGDWDWYFAAVQEAWPKALQEVARYVERAL